jgi:type III pantothenate kinase
MMPNVVADVGNSRIKWGRCENGRVTASAALPPDDLAAWQHQAERWGLPSPGSWAIAGVHPGRRDRLADWVRGRGDTVLIVDNPRQLPLRVLVDRPEQVGLDRLLDAVAANRRRPGDRPAAIIDAGSAVTVDWVDATGAFRGGAILPGLRLMAQSLHDYTALLPVIEPPRRPPVVPGTATVPALEAGIFWAVAGGVRVLLDHLAAADPAAPATVFLTGGDAPTLQPALGEAVHPWPDMTLEGIRLTAEALS